MIGIGRLRAALVLTATILLASSARASLYYVAIGSTHYVDAPSDARAFPRLGGANKSARAVADRLRRGGAVDGIVLTSALDHFVTTADVDRVLDEIAGKIRARHDKAPFLVVYYAGHGISEGVGWNHFLVPGTFAYKGDSSHLDIEGLAAATTHSAALVERLNKSSLRYMLVLDTCSEGAEAEFHSSVLTGPAISSLQSVSAVLRFMNEFHQADPVLFSTAPGTKVLTADDPTNPSSEQVGPLGRRLMILLDPALQAHRSMQLDEIVAGLRDAKLDPATAPAISEATPDATWSRTILRGAAPDGLAPQSEFGSGKSAVICCAPPAPTPADISRSVTGSIRIGGTPREYVTDGKTLEIASPAYALTLIETKGALRLEAEKAGDTWAVELSAPHDAKLAEKTYHNAGRSGFDDDRPGIEITAPGRGCNDLTGELEVKSVRYDPTGRLAHLEASLTQRCTDATGHAWATLHIDAAER